MMYIQDNYVNDGVNNNHHQSFSSCHSIRDVSYSCGSCGYALNLSSSNRNTSAISSKYGKSMKRGIISFLSIDESRFIQKEEFQCLPFFLSNDSWGLFRRRTKLLCHKCGSRVGTAYEDNTSFEAVGSDVFESSSGKKTSTHKKFDIKIRALQPSCEESGVPLVL